MKSGIQATATCPQFTNSEDLMLLWRAQPFTDEACPINYPELIRTNPALEMVLGLGPCLTYILDIRTGKFAFISNNAERLLGYPPSMFKHDGFNLVSSLMHADDRNQIGEMTYIAWKYLLTLPVKQRQCFQINRKYRIVKADQTYAALLEQNMVLQTDRKGNITHLLGMCTDISNLGSVNTFQASVFSANDQNQPCALHAYLSDKLKPLNLLSKREREIIKLVAAGYSSKLIADQLYISFNTVNTHRRNIIEKTKSKNTGGLVQYAISHGII